MSRSFTFLLTLLTSLTFFLTLTFGLRHPLPASTATYGATATTGVATVQYTSFPNSFSAPHLSLINSTVFEWWYFSALSITLDAFMLITFFTSTGNASVDVLPGNLDLSVAAVFVFPNGTFVTSVGLANTATVAYGGSLGSGAVGNWTGADVQGDFAISPDLSHGHFALDAPSVKGAVQLQSVAPPHHPCSANVFSPGQDIRVYPNVGWVNPMPAAITTGEFIVNGDVLHFDGAIGYSDQNWGDKPFAYKNFYWGRATLGNYHAVWWNGTAPDGSPQTSAYLSYKGRVLSASCADGAVSVHPFGAGATFPPALGHPDFDYLAVVFKVAGKGTFAFNVTKTYVLPTRDPIPPGVVAKGLGLATGGWHSGWYDKELTGPVEWEVWAHE